MKISIISIFNSLILGLIVLLAIFIFLSNSDWFWDMVSPIFYKEIIYKYSEMYEVDPLLASAVIKVESNFQAYAQSPRGAMGLMQIMPETGKEMARRLKIKPFVASDLNNPEINIKIGLYYLTRLKKQFNGDVYLALAAYNGGSANVQKWLAEKKIDTDGVVDQIPFEETKGFVQKVMRNYEWFKNVQQVKKMLQFRKKED
ncbi:MAG: lytic transglycosylase domain-containing protein [Candidatus Desantisbacteria bacterium]